MLRGKQVPLRVRHQAQYASSLITEARDVGDGAVRILGVRQQVAVRGRGAIVWRVSQRQLSLLPPAIDDGWIESYFRGKRARSIVRSETPADVDATPQGSDILNG